MWIAVLAVLVLVLLFLYLDTIKPRNFPPGPIWVPILGCANQVNKLREKTGYLYKALKELSVTYCNDGPVLGIKIGKDRVVFVNSLEANKEMLYNEDIDGRPKGSFYQDRTWGQRRGVLLTDGELWREQRRFLMKHLKEFGFGRRGMGDIARSEAIYMVKDVMTLIDAKNDGGVIEMHNFFNTYILNTLWTMMAGIRYDAFDPQMKVLQAMLFDLFRTIDMVGALFSHFPILRFLAPTASGFRDFMRIHKRIWKFLRDEISRQKEKFDEEKEDQHFMEVYIRVLKQYGEVGTYSEGQLVAMCMDMFMAGTETTSKSMSFCFCYMVREQEVQKRAQEEIDRVVGKERMPCLDDRVSMPYNEAVVHESVRHFMGRTLGVPHRALKDTTLSGYNIPEDTMVVSNFTNLMMDEALFPDPLAFKPERFLIDGKVCIPDHYFPFGLGKHRCMGDVLAKCNIFVFTTTMLQRFSFKPAPGEPLPSLKHVDGVTPSAAPFKALVEPRW